MKKLALAIAVVAAVAVVSTFAVLPQLGLWRLERAMFAATDAKTAAEIARAILLTSSPRATDVLVRFVRAHPWCGFDPVHQVALFCDETDGQIYIVYVGPSGPRAATGDPAMDKAVEAAIPEIDSHVLSLGQPPRLFDGVHRLHSTTNQVDFVLRPAANDPWCRLRFEFTDGRLRASGLHDVTDADLSQWRQNHDWPKSW